MNIGVFAGGAGPLGACAIGTLLAWPSSDADATIAACSLDFVRSRLQDRPELRHSWLARVVVASTLLTSILGVTNQLDPLAQGLKAEYFSDESGSSPAVASALDSQPSTGHFIEAW